MNKRNIKKNILFFIICGVILFLIIIYAKFIWYIFSPLFIGLIIAYILSPLVNGLCRRKINRIISIIIAYLSILIVFVLILLFLIPQVEQSITELVQKLPDYLEKYKIIAEEYKIRYEYSGLPRELQDTFINTIVRVEGYIIKFLNNIMSLFLNSVSIFLEIFLGIIISIYLLIDIKSIKKRIIKKMPEKYKKDIITLIKDIDMVLSGFIRGQLFISIILSIITIVGLLILKIKYAIILGIIAGFTNIIPYFGPIIGAVPALIISFLDMPIKALWVLLFYGVLQQIESSILSPKIVGRRVGLHPIITITLIYAGGKLFGFIGLLVIIPISGVIKVLINNLIEKSNYLLKK